jgi:hypothetical protein
MEPYKGYFIDGSALMTHPFRRDWYVCGDVFVQGCGTSIVGVTRFQLDGSPWTSKNWRNGSAWSLRGSWWMSACRSEKVEGCDWQD